MANIQHCEKNFCDANVLKIANNANRLDALDPPLLYCSGINHGPIPDWLVSSSAAVQSLIGQNNFWSLEITLNSWEARFLHRMKEKCWAQVISVALTRLKQQAELPFLVILCVPWEAIASYYGLLQCAACSNSNGLSVCLDIHCLSMVW